MTNITSRCSKAPAVSSQWQGKGFLFVVDSDDNIMHPDSVTDYCNRFSEKYGLRHVNSHAFRHTMASLLYFAGMDSVSISAHLGHAKDSTTADLYSHVISEAQSRIANAMGEIILTTRKPINSMPEHTPKTKLATG